MKSGHLTTRRGLVLVFWVFVGGPVQNACSGVGLNEGPTQLVATAVEEKLINLPFFSRLSKHGFARHHGCAWFLN
jgi:hypothetical protein